MKSTHSRARLPAAPRHQILVVDDHPLMREGISKWIESEPDLQVCCQAGSTAEAMKWLGRKHPDLVITDLTLAGRSGIELIKDVRALHPDLPILVLSMHDELLYASRVLRAGANGYIMKEAGGANLVAAVRQVLRGGLYVNPRVADKIIRGYAHRRPRGSTSPIEQLSDREFEVFQLVGQGCDSREIAVRLHLSPRTVDVHRANIKRKLALKSTAALVRAAVHLTETNPHEP